MRPADRLSAFVADALRAGHARPGIVRALTEAGWSRGEAEKALADWAEVPYPLPVPRPRPAVSAHEALVYGLMFVALAVSVFQVVNLGFLLIDAWLGAADLDWSAWRERGALASLVVFAPLFLALNLRTGRAARADRSLRRSAVRDWLAHGAMFVAALTLVGDLVSAISAALGGGLHPDFLAKSALVALMAGAIYLYFRGFTRAPEA